MAKDETTPEEKEKGTASEEGGGVVEDEETVVVNLGGKGREEAVGEDGEEEVEEKAKGKEKEKGEEKEVAKAPVEDFATLLENAKEELRKESKGKEKTGVEGPPYSEATLDAAEDTLDKLLDDGEISRPEYRRYMRNIAKERENNRETAIAARLTKRGRVESAEKFVTRWAEENDPDSVNPRTKKYRDAVEWARETLGAEEDGEGNFVMSKKVGAVIFGILHTGQNKGVEKGKEAERKKVEDGRRKELQGRDNKPPARKEGEKEGPTTSKEKEILQKLGHGEPEAMKRLLPIYRKLREGKPGERGASVEVK